VSNAVIILAIGLVATAFGADEFRYPVIRGKLLKDEPGQLEISKGGLSYRSADGKTAIRVPLQDILEADLSDPKVIHIETYDILKRRLTGRRVYTFRLRDSRHDEALTRFLVDALPRPVIGAFGTASQGAFEILAYHRHRLGGCHGKLEIGADAIRFVSDRPGDSRTWLYRDVETIGNMTPFHFRVSTLVETYNFDLKDRLREDAYRLAWQHVHRLSGGDVEHRKPPVD